MYNSSDLTLYRNRTIGYSQPDSAWVVRDGTWHQWQSSLFPWTLKIAFSFDTNH